MRIALLSIIILVAGILAPCRTATALAPEFSSPERLMQWTFTYRSHVEPNRVPEAVRAMYELGLLRDEEKTGFFIGFVAGVLNKNPKSAAALVSRMLPLPPKEQAVIIKAIGYSGLTDWPVLMQKFAPQMKERKLLIDDFLTGTEPGLLATPWDPGPVVVYTLWGFYVATGDTEPVQRVISALAWSRKDEGSAFSWKRIASSIGWGNDAEQQIELERLIIGSTAKWTLVSYAEHHRELVALYREEIETRPEKVSAPLQEVLEASERFEAERVRREEMAAVDLMKQKLALSGSSGTRAAYAGSVGIATACVVAGAVGHPEIAVPCVVTGALYSGAMRILGR